MAKNQPNFTQLSSKLRKELTLMHHKSKYSHLGSDLSCLDILISLYFNIMKPEDKFILSKGHSALALYAVLHEKGIISDEVYNTLGKDGSLLGEHPLTEIDGIEFPTGSLGHGLSLACGMALAKKMNKQKGTIYVLLSDGECQEGSTCEAINFASRSNLDNLAAFIDWNGFQAYDTTLLSKSSVINQFKDAGWIAWEINGHDFIQIRNSIKINIGKPQVVIANTILGKGIKQIENKLEWHYKVPSEEQLKEFIGST